MRACRVYVCQHDELTWFSFLRALLQCGEPRVQTGVVTTSVIDIAGKTNVKVAAKIGAKQSNVFDMGDGVKVFAQFEDGSRDLLGNFASSQVFNQQLYYQLNGKQYLVFEDMNEYTFDVDTSGHSSLQVVFELTSNAANEKLALDDIVVTGEGSVEPTPEPTPEPTLNPCAAVRCEGAPLTNYDDDNDGDVDRCYGELDGCCAPRVECPAVEQARLAAMNYIENNVIRVETLVGQDGKLFGSVTPLMISNKLAEAGYYIDRRQVTITDVIKTVGDYRYTVDFFGGYTAQGTVSVVKSNSN